MINRLTAIRRLERRYDEQSERFPLMRRDISREDYVKANVALVMKRDLLKSYDTAR